MPVTRTVRIGIDGFLYRNSGTYGAPTWVEMKHVKDLTIAVEVNEVEANDRDSIFELIEKGLVKMTVEFGYRYADGDSEWEQLLTDLLSRGDGTEYAVMDGDITDTGEVGWRITAHVMAANQSQELETAMALDVTLRPAANADGNPQRYTAP